MYNNSIYASNFTGFFPILICVLSAYTLKSFQFQLRREGRVSNVSDVVSKGQKVKVKVLSITGTKVSLSMKVSIIFFCF